MDRVARETELDRAEVRRRNLIPAEKMPYHQAAQGALRRSRCNTTAAIIPAARRMCCAPPAGTIFRAARPRRARKAATSASGSRTASRAPAAARSNSACVQISPTGRITVFDRRRRDGAGARHGAGADLRRASSACARTRSRWLPATPPARRSASAASPAGRRSPPARRCCSRRRPSPTRRSKLASHMLEAAEARSRNRRRRGARRRRAAACGQARRTGAHAQRRAGLRLPARHRSRARGESDLPHRCARLCPMPATSPRSRSISRPAACTILRYVAMQDSGR